MAVNDHHKLVFQGDRAASTTRLLAAPLQVEQQHLPQRREEVQICVQEVLEVIEHLLYLRDELLEVRGLAQRHHFFRAGGCQAQAEATIAAVGGIQCGLRLGRQELLPRPQQRLQQPLEKVAESGAHMVIQAGLAQLLKMKKDLMCRTPTVDADERSGEPELLHARLIELLHGVVEGIPVLARSGAAQIHLRDADHLLLILRHQGSPKLLLDGRICWFHVGPQPIQVHEALRHQRRHRQELPWPRSRLHRHLRFRTRGWRGWRMTEQLEDHYLGDSLLRHVPHQCKKRLSQRARVRLGEPPLVEVERHREYPVRTEVAKAG
mmetsp:Transcript_22147/g.48428  ORF Transcript_22147/g.48428 Transcript_22147/m.48428 type:complete len:321 (-) Transcript_22147:372-1334(-)